MSKKSKLTAKDKAEFKKMLGESDIVNLSDLSDAIKEVGKSRRKETKKPNIELVFAAFQKFHTQATTIRTMSIREPAKWEKQMQEFRDELKTTLDKYGIGQHIDWKMEE